MPDFSPRCLLPYLPLPVPTTPVVWWVGFSGGLDSTVLLHALAQLQLPVRLQALHINHQISPHADGWQAQCMASCARLAIPFFAEKVQVVNSGKGIEDAARVARYQVFERYVGQGDSLFTAHHANDQAETLLLRLMRGAGPRGLAAIASERRLATGGILIRPLLQFSRADLEAYAHAQHLSWVEDESNQDDYYDRNFLRNQIMPLLHSRWPGFGRKWQQTAELCARQESLLEEFAQQDLLAAQPRTERVGQSIDLGVLLGFSAARQQNLLRYWLRLLGYTTPEQLHWQQIERQIIHGHEDAKTRVTWGQVALQTYRQRLYALPLQMPELELHLVLGVDDAQPGLKANLPDLQVRYRTGGERCKPAGRPHSQTLKKLLQEYALEPWLRDLVPLVYSGETLVAVGDLWICAGYAALAGEAAFKLEWCAAQ